MLIDAHTHIAKYENNLDEVFREINEHKILTISNSMDVFAFEKNLKIAENCKLIMPTFGIHPWSATEYSYKLENLIEYINQSPMIGEIGLDHRVRPETFRQLIRRILQRKRLRGCRDPCAYPHLRRLAVAGDNLLPGVRQL